jgi:hypothetical protein
LDRKNIIFGFGDTKGKFYGQRPEGYNEEFAQAEKAAMKDALKAAECMKFLEDHYGETDPAQLAAWLMNFVFSFHVSASVDVREQSEVAVKITDMRKKAEAILDSLLKHSNSPEEAIAIIGLAFNMLYTSTKMLREQGSKEESEAFNLFDEIDKSIKRNLGK